MPNGAPTSRPLRVRDQRDPETALATVIMQEMTRTPAWMPEFPLQAEIGVYPKPCREIRTQPALCAYSFISGSQIRLLDAALRQCLPDIGLRNSKLPCDCGRDTCFEGGTHCIQLASGQCAKPGCNWLHCLAASRSPNGGSASCGHRTRNGAARSEALMRLESGLAMAKVASPVPPYPRHRIRGPPVAYEPLAPRAVRNRAVASTHRGSSSRRPPVMVR